jgi:hypothetical protein
MQIGSNIDRSVASFRKRFSARRHQRCQGAPLPGPMPTQHFPVTKRRKSSAKTTTYAHTLSVLLISPATWRAWMLWSAVRRSSAPAACRTKPSESLHAPAFRHILLCPRIQLTNDAPRAGQREPLSRRAGAASSPNVALHQLQLKPQAARVRLPVQLLFRTHQSQRDLTVRTHPADCSPAPPFRHSAPNMRAVTQQLLNPCQQQSAHSVSKTKHPANRPEAVQIQFCSHHRSRVQRLLTSGHQPTCTVLDRHSFHALSLRLLFSFAIVDVSVFAERRRPHCLDPSSVAFVACYKASSE